MEFVEVRSQGATPAAMAAWSLGIAFPKKEDMTRQEFAEESDVNNILRKFAGGGYPLRPVNYGVQDFTLDLDGAYAAARVSVEAWDRLPVELRSRFSGWPELLAAMEKGEVTLSKEAPVGASVGAEPSAPVPPVVVPPVSS